MIKLIKFLLFIVSLFLITCAPPTPRCVNSSHEKQFEMIVCLDHEFSDEFKIAAEQAMFAWTDALCGLIEIRPAVVQGDEFPPLFCDKMIYRVYSSYTWVSLRSEDVAGFFENDYAWIIVDRVPNKLTKQVFMHELGHLFGVTHGDGIMNPVLSTSSDHYIDQRAIIQATIHITSRKSQFK